VSCIMRWDYQLIAGFAITESHRAKAASRKSPGAHFYQHCVKSLVCGVRLCNSCHFIHKPEHTGQLQLSEGAGAA